jgi:hypothetical protein
LDSSSSGIAKPRPLSCGAASERGWRPHAACGNACSFSAVRLLRPQSSVPTLSARPAEQCHGWGSMATVLLGRRPDGPATKPSGTMPGPITEGLRRVQEKLSGKTESSVGRARPLETYQSAIHAKMRKRDLVRARGRESWNGHTWARLDAS